MTKFHVNSETGEPGKCRASAGNCPFGSEDQHFSSREEARDAYEAQMKAYEEFKKSPIGRLDALADGALKRLRSGMDKAVEWLDDNPKIVIGGAAVIAAAVAAVVAFKVLSPQLKALTSNPVEGVINGGGLKPNVVGVPGKGGFITMKGEYEVLLPDGSVHEYTSTSSKLLEDGTKIPLHLYSDGTIHSNPAADDTIPVVAGAAALGAVGGAGGGIVSNMLIQTGADKLRDWLYSGWDLRHERNFGLVNWRTA